MFFLAGLDGIGVPILDDVIDWVDDNVVDRVWNWIKDDACAFILRHGTAAIAVAAAQPELVAAIESNPAVARKACREGGKAAKWLAAKFVQEKERRGKTLNPAEERLRRELEAAGARWIQEQREEERRGTEDSSATWRQLQVLQSQNRGQAAALSAKRSKTTQGILLLALAGGGFLAWRKWGKRKRR